MISLNVRYLRAFPCQYVGMYDDNFRLDHTFSARVKYNILLILDCLILKCLE